MSIEVSKGGDLKIKIVQVVKDYVEVVGSSMGPFGSNTLIQDEDGTLRISKDGVSISRAYSSLADPASNMILQILRGVAEKSVTTAGDGTSGSVILVGSILLEGLKAIKEGSNVIEIQRGIQKATAAIITKLKTISTDVTTEDVIKKVAKLSANGDEHIANLITQAVDAAGTDGVVTIEESKTGEDYLDIVEGLSFDKGLKSPYFVTNQMKAEANLKNPLIFLTDYRLSTNAQVIPLLNYAAEKDRPLLIIADDFDGEAYACLVVNKQRGIVSVAAVKAPEYGPRKLEALEDIAVITGAIVVTDVKGYKLEKMKDSDFEKVLGTCRIANISNTDTTLVDGKPSVVLSEDGTQEVNPVETRLLEIKTQYDNAKTPFEKENLQARIGKLTGGVAIIHVGGNSDVEMKEKKDRVDDALHATKAAILEGIVPGGGMALIACEDVLNSLELPNKDQEVGREIIRKAIYSPFEKILSNAGIDHKAVLQSIEHFASDMWYGYNVRTAEYGNLLEMGIIDPTKVVMTALINASSTAATSLTTTSAISKVAENTTPSYVTKEELQGMMG